MFKNTILERHQDFLEMSNKISLKILQYISFVVLIVLALISAIYTRNSVLLDEGLTGYSFDHPMLLLLAVVVLYFALPRASALFSTRKKEHALLVTILIFFTLCCFGLVIWGKCAPSGDSYSVYDVAYNFSENFYLSIAHENSYLSYYPQQLGLAVFYEYIYRFESFLPGEIQVYHIIKVVNSIFVLVIIFSQWNIVREIAPRTKASVTYLLLVPFCFPLYFYSSFVYGEIPSLAMISLAWWFALLYDKKKHIGTLLLTVLTTAAAILLRKNSLIFLIALVLLLVLGAMRAGKKNLLLLGFVTAAFSIAAPMLLQVSYEQKANATLSTGVSTYSYIAMGMQDSENGAGLYNGYNFSLYDKYGGDQELINAESKAYIQERLLYFLSEPAEAISFYWQKLVNQWADSDFCCRDFTHVDYGGRSEFVASIYSGELSAIFVGMTNLYQFTIWIGAILFLVYAIKKAKEEKIKALHYVGILTLVGGFLFHLMWEAGPRYGVIYFVMMLPYAAIGFKSNRHQER